MTNNMKENRSVNRVLIILELISKHPAGLTLGQVYRMLEIPKATAYDMLQTLYKQDAVYYRDPNLRNYVIGSKMYAIGSVYTQNSNLIEASKSFLIDYSNETGQTSFVTKRVKNKIIYVYKYEPANQKIVTPEEIGTVIFDFENNFIGQVYSIFDEKVKNINVKDYEAIRKKGYSTKLSGESNHISSVAVPIWNFENRVCGVIVSSDLAVSDNKNHDVTNRLVEIGKKISRSLGYLGDFS